MRFTNCPACGAHVVHRRDGAVARHKAAGGVWCEGGAAMSVTEAVRVRAIQQGRPICTTCGRPVNLNRRGDVCPHHAPGGKVCRGPSSEIVDPQSVAGAVARLPPVVAPTPPPPDDPAGYATIERIVKLSCGHFQTVLGAGERARRRCRKCHVLADVLAA